jgi:hypothetical protein
MDHTGGGAAAPIRLMQPASRIKERREPVQLKSAGGRNKKEEK